MCLSDGGFSDLGCLRSTELPAGNGLVIGSSKESVGAIVGKKRREGEAEMGVELLRGKARDGASTDVDAGHLAVEQAQQLGGGGQQLADGGAGTQGKGAHRHRRLVDGVWLPHGDSTEAVAGPHLDATGLGMGQGAHGCDGAAHAWQRLSGLNHLDVVGVLEVEHQDGFSHCHPGRAG